jgi:hypothetical protein
MESAGNEREGGVQVGAVGIAPLERTGRRPTSHRPLTALGRARASVEWMSGVHILMNNSLIRHPIDGLGELNVYFYTGHRRSHRYGSIRLGQVEEPLRFPHFSQV